MCCAAIRRCLPRPIGQVIPPLLQVCRGQHLIDSPVRRRLAHYDTEQAGQAGTGRALTPDQQRIRELERECQRLRDNVSTLKLAGKRSLQVMR